VENKKYGWFWECPNGGEKCLYQHCLPPGFVLKSHKKKEEEEDVEEIPLEEILEQERAKLMTRTPLTLETFLKWKEIKREREAKEKEERIKKESSTNKGSSSMRSGREMFEYDPSLFIDDDEALETDDLRRDEYDGPLIEIDVTGTSIRTTLVGDDKNEEGQESGAESQDGDQGEDEEGEEGEEEEKEDQEGDQDTSEPINESLFKEEDIPDEVD